MKKLDHKIPAHLFVCTHNRETGESCGAKGSAELRDQIKENLFELKGQVRVNNSGCLGRCKEGIVCVLYPSGMWFSEGTKSDAKPISQAIVESLKSS